MEINTMRSIYWAAMPLVLVLTAISGIAEAATIKATVDLSSQRCMFMLTERRDTRGLSLRARRGGGRSQGCIRRSSKWRMSLPYLTWIGEDGTAIHGTYLTSKLGRPASHGCIRLSINNAAKFYKLVEQNGFWSTRVEVRR
jgi:hypothetical protein